MSKLIRRKLIRNILNLIAYILPYYILLSNPEVQQLILNRLHCLIHRSVRV